MMSTGADIVVHPHTGEVLERLDEQPPEILAELLHAITEDETRLKQWGDLTRSELRRRLKLRQTRVAVFGEWEVEASVKRESNWDADELERALERYELTDAVAALDGPIVTREPVVSRSRAKALLRRLSGDAYQAVDAACAWHEKPGPLTVTRSVDLLDAAPPPAAQRTPPDGPSEGSDAAVTPTAGSRAWAPPTLSPAGPSTTSPPLDPKELFA